mmetsp:Transcript_90591/g.270285  ORF Transcript_90591/g.270285 Transcript_90591/m.270285 type:complete len:267 (+) Transcript_90591:20-820(+)
MRPARLVPGGTAETASFQWFPPCPQCPRLGKRPREELEALLQSRSVHCGEDAPVSKALLHVVRKGGPLREAHALPRPRRRGPHAVRLPLELHQVLWTGGRGHGSGGHCGCGLGRVALRGRRRNPQLADGHPVLGGHGKFPHAHDVRVIVFAIDQAPEEQRRAWLQHVVRDDHRLRQKQAHALQHSQVFVVARAALIHEDGRDLEVVSAAIPVGQPGQKVLAVARPDVDHVREPCIGDNVPGYDHVRWVHLQRYDSHPRQRQGHADS